MNPNVTDITVVLDRSGSMASVASDTKNGFDQFIKDQKAVEGKANLTLMQFDTEYEFVYKDKNIQEIEPLDFRPRGFTALLDAIGKSIAETGERLEKIPADDRPGKVVFVILTDGQENSSKEYKREQINKMITEQREKYAWEFVFLGANQDAIKEGESLGISVASSVNYAHTSTGVQNAFMATSRNVASYRLGASANVAYSDEDRKKMEK